MNRIWRLLERNVRDLLEKELLLLEEDVVGIEPQDFLPWPQHSDMCNFCDQIKEYRESTTIGNVYSRNEKEKCITIMVVRSVTPYILVEKCQTSQKPIFTTFMIKNYAYWSFKP